MREQVRGWEGPLFLLFAVPLSRELYFVPVGSHSEHFARGVGNLLEFRFLSCVNTP
jgi:hypothetical protein